MKARYASTTAFTTATGIMAPPISYEVGGTQYISVAVGWGGPTGRGNQFTDQINPGTVYTFALDANAPYPNYPKTAPKTLANFAFDEEEALVAQGAQLYLKNCSHCHRQVARETGGAIPDLGYMAESIYNNFENIVLKGALEANGMPNFGSKLQLEEVQSIKSFILSQAKAKLEASRVSEELQ